MARHLRLGAQLLSGLALIAITVAIVAGVIIRQVETSYLRSYISQEKQKAFELLLSSLLDDIIAEDVPQIETAMRQLVQRDTEFAAARITNEAGLVLYAWRSNGAEDDEDGFSWLVGPAHKLVRFAQNVRFLGETFGRFEVEWDVAAAEREVYSHSLLIVLGVGSVCLLLSLLVYLLTNAFAVRPINRISQRVAGFRAGIYGQKSDLPGFAAEELHRLEESVNDLSAFLAQREQRQAELQAAKDAAEKASHAKTEFLANVSHELRTPLNAINGFSEMMALELYGPIGDERYRDYAQKINFSGQHLLSLINDILDISRVEAGKASLDLAELDPRKLIADVAGMIEEQCRTSSLALDVNLPEHLPRIRGDDRRLKQVLLNLLSNSIKYTPAGGSVALVAEWRPKAGLVIEVSDTGIGIDPARLKTAFEPFSRIESAYSRGNDGTGLGLPLAEAMVRLHGGFLELKSEPGVGTDAIVTLPATLALGIAEEAAPSTPRAASSS